MTVIPAETHSRVEAFGRQEVNEDSTMCRVFKRLTIPQNFQSIIFRVRNICEFLRPVATRR